MIRSYRVCFEFERRIFRFERWRIPLPWGLPVRSIVYFVAVLMGLLVLGRIPGASALLGILPLPIRYVIVPVGLAYLLTELRIDGRPAHSALVAIARWKSEPKRIAAGRAIAEPGRLVRFADVTLAPDERFGRYRRAQVRGPARITLRYPAQARHKGRELSLEQTSEQAMWRGKVLSVPEGARMVIR